MMLHATMFAVVVLSQVMEASVSPQMIRVSLVRYANATCNDGTPAVYYRSVYQRGEEMRNVLIYLPGGAMCVSERSCEERCTKTPYRCTTSGEWYKREDRGILSANPDINPHFYSWLKVYIHYCSSDLYVGNKRGTDDSMYFKGQHIFQAVIDDLLNTAVLGRAPSVLLAGSSAGTMGVAHKCDSLQKLLTNSKVKCLIDSPFLLPRPPYFTHISADWPVKLKPAAAGLWNSDFLSDLDLFNWIRQIRTPLFIIANKWDVSFMKMMNATIGNIQQAKEWSENVLRVLEKEAKVLPDLGVFVAGCAGHVLLNKDSTYTELLVGPHNTSLVEAIWNWYEEAQEVQIWDTCQPNDNVSVSCNPKCPNLAVLDHPPPRLK